MNYYNEFDPYAAQWLRNLIAEGLIPDGFVDERSIKDVPADFLKGFAQCHFFAGIGGWPLALRLAGWPDDKPAWTGSCPCQPYSAAGSQKGFEDERDLWPVWFNLIAEVEPAVVFGEQVSAAIGQHWLDRVRLDLERSGYALGAAVLPSCAVGAPHKRDRLWFVADASRQRDDRTGQAGRNEFTNGGYDVADANSERWQSGEFTAEASRHRDPLVANGSHVADTQRPRHQERISNTGILRASHGPLKGQISARHVSHVGDTDGQRSEAGLSASPARQAGQSEIAYNGSNGRPGPWGKCEWLIGADGKARRVEPSIRLLAHGVPARVGKLRAFGNAIVPDLAAEFIAAYAECRP